MTIKEIAKLAGVSTATVSYVINGTKNVSEAKRRRVQEAVDRAGYQPNQIAKSLRINSTRTIGVVVEDIMGFPVPAMINGISEYVEQQDYHLLLSDLRILERVYNQYQHTVELKDKINGAVSLLQGARVDAIIYVGLFDRDITGIINPIQQPLVVAYSTHKTPGGLYVTYDSERVSEELTRHLISRGHRRVAVITGLPGTDPAVLRLQGVRRAMEDAGLTLDPNLVMPGDWEYQSGYDCALRLLRQGGVRPSVIFAMNDLMAAGALDAINACGLRVPRDISLLGFDNREVSGYLTPRLSTVNINLKEIGRTAARMAIDRLKGLPLADTHTVIPSELVFRDTVGDCLEK